MFAPEEMAAYLEQYNEAPDFWRAMWEPEFGDWVQTKHGIGIITELVLSTTLIVQEQPVYRVDYAPHGQNYPFKVDMIPLFTEGQLIKMIEERGYKRIIIKIRPGWCETAIAEGSTYPKKDNDGPTPIIALMRALVEITEKENQP